jgi:hypothetical protein
VQEQATPQAVFEIRHVRTIIRIGDQYLDWRGQLTSDKKKAAGFWFEENARNFGAQCGYMMPNK